METSSHLHRVYLPSYGDDHSDLRRRVEQREFPDHTHDANGSAEVTKIERYRQALVYIANYHPVEFSRDHLNAIKNTARLAIGSDPPPGEFEKSITLVLGNPMKYGEPK